MRMKSQIRKRYVSVSAYVEYEAIGDFWQPETNSNFLRVVYATHGFASVHSVYASLLSMSSITTDKRISARIVNSSLDFKTP